MCILSAIFTNYIPKIKTHETDPLVHLEDIEPQFNPLQVEYFKDGLTDMQLISNLNFYLFFFVFMVTAGAQFNIVNNIGSLLLALGGKQGY